MVVDPYEVVLGALAIAIMICVPILAVFVFDLLVGRWDQTIEHWRNVRALRNQHGVPIERLAADLRRLRADLSHDETRSATHQIGARLAYDGLLIQACDMLGVQHDLRETTAGFDRDIERLRVEAALESAGLVLTDPRRRGQDVW
ncbi:hypothetical protein GCM10009841_06810 [Microlunatus panaciterrae]|uniref:Uncharacterized protein n=1 Tax=Microlunatus panaciterrae TaxID=400768 RepID=A0ABS2RI43_9ACTN|nr:hypothetical protein [Microlunatus panaciterrae]MBM7798666.1 hypothetical protein [Microlunatus panaciterrae]